MEMKEIVAKKEIEGSSAFNYLKPVRLLLDMNDLQGSVNWKQGYRVLHSSRRYTLDRAPTIEEVRLLVENSDLRSQMIILMASGGFRLGAWQWLSWADIEPIVQNDSVIAAKVVIYRGEPEEYFCYITPEAFGKLDAYMQQSADAEERITKQSPILRNK